MTTLVFCDPMHNPCEVDYVSDADRLSDMVQHFRERENWAGWRRALYLWARVSSEWELPLYGALMRE